MTGAVEDALTIVRDADWLRLERDASGVIDGCMRSIQKLESFCTLSVRFEVRAKRITTNSRTCLSRESFCYFFSCKIIASAISRKKICVSKKTLDNRSDVFRAACGSETQPPLPLAIVTGPNYEKLEAEPDFLFKVGARASVSFLWMYDTGNVQHEQKVAYTKPVYKHLVRQNIRRSGTTED